MHATSSVQLDPKGAAELAAATERVGDGKQLTLDHFPHLSLAERTALYHADKARYEALRDGIDPDAAWTPTAGKEATR